MWFHDSRLHVSNTKCISQCFLSVYEMEATLNTQLRACFFQCCALDCVYVHLFLLVDFSSLNVFLIIIFPSYFNFPSQNVKIVVYCCLCFFYVLHRKVHFICYRWRILDFRILQTLVNAITSSEYICATTTQCKNRRKNACENEIKEKSYNNNNNKCAYESLI